MKRFAKVFSLFLVLSLLLSGCRLADFVRALRDGTESSGHEETEKATEKQPTETVRDTNRLTDGYYEVLILAKEGTEAHVNVYWKIELPFFTVYDARDPEAAPHRIACRFDEETGIYTTSHINDPTKGSSFRLKAIDGGFEIWNSGENGFVHDYDLLVVDPADHPVLLRQIEKDRFDPDFRFTTTDSAGNPVTEDLLSGRSLTMINLWAYWCGPCVGEMPDLQKLYEAYRSRGLQIWGLYDPSEEQPDLKTAKEMGIRYPLIRYTAAFDPYMNTGYIPTTIFVDGNGHIVGETVVGSRSYEQWAKIIEGLLK